jgi:hypothetical protein
VSIFPFNPDKIVVFDVVRYNLSPCHPSNQPPSPFPALFFYKNKYKQIDKKLRLSLIMSTCYLGALSDPVENIFFFLGVRLTKQEILPKLFGEFYFVCHLSVVFCFYIQRGRNQIKVYPKTY